MVDPYQPPAWPQQGYPTGPPGAGGAWGPPQVPRRPGMSTGLKVFLIVASIVSLVVVLICAGLVYIGMRSPAIDAIPGRQVPTRYLTQIRDLGLIGPTEKILYFYSDAMLDIEEGMYFFTNEKVVVYSTYLDPPEIIVAYDEIAEMGAEFSDEFFIDGVIWLNLHDGSQVTMPVPSVGGGDERFFDLLQATWERNRRD